MKHEVRPNSSIASAALLLGVSVDAVIMFHTEMKAWDLGQKLKSKSEKIPKKPAKTDKNT
jgi:hypothetical protein